MNAEELIKQSYPTINFEDKWDYLTQRFSADDMIHFAELYAQTKSNGVELIPDKCHIQNVVGSKPTCLMVESGKSYRLRHPNGAGDKDRLHIDYILDNPTNSHLSYKLVVCRYWEKHKQRWFYYTYPYFSLAIYNDWDYGGDDV